MWLLFLTMSNHIHTSGLDCSKLRRIGKPTVKKDVIAVIPCDAATSKSCSIVSVAFIRANLRRFPTMDILSKSFCVSHAGMIKDCGTKFCFLAAGAVEKGIIKNEDVRTLFKQYSLKSSL